MINPAMAFRGLALGASLGALLVSPAFALDAETFGQRLKDSLAQQGTTLDWSQMEPTADGFVMRGVVGGSVGVDRTFRLGDMTVSGVGEDGESMTVDELFIESFSEVEDGHTVTVGPIEITGLVIPPAGSDEVAYYDTASIEEVTIDGPDGTVFAIGGVAFEIERDDADGSLSFSGYADSFQADLSTIEDEQSRAVAAALGYDRFSGSFELEGSWSPTDGRLILDRYDVTIDDAGMLSVALDMSGYTPEFMASLREVQQRAEGASDSSAQGLAVMGLMQQVSFHGATIRFEDDTLTSKVLEFFAAQQGARSADVVNQAKAVLPFMLAQLGNPDFARQVSAAVSSFLDDPQSLTIRAAPAEPVPFAMLAAEAMMAPEGLPQQLGVVVSAND